MARERLYLVDAHALIFQVFHAIPEMSSPSGLPTNALFGFTRDLLYLRNEKHPEYLIVVFDAPGKTFRDDLYAEYKAQRGPMPDDLQLQIPLIRELLEAMHVPVLSMSGYEADDLIATLARAGEQAGMEVFICSSDKDCRQLLSPCVKIYNLRKHQVFDSDSLKEDWGITPEQVIDLQTLVGDSVDNVPGVPGVGLKTAAKLLQDFQTLENVLANVDKISGAKRQENLRAAAATVALSRQLVRLATDVPMELNWEAWRLADWDARQLLKLFQQWGFHRFADQVREIAMREGGTLVREGEIREGEAPAEPRYPARPEPRPPVSGNYRQEELFPFGANVEGEEELLPPATNGWLATYHLVNTPELLQTFAQKLSAQTRIAVDLEMTGPNPLHSILVGLAFSWQEGEAWYLPVRGPAGEKVLDLQEEVLQVARPVLENPAVAKVNQNIKYDLLVLRELGIRLAGVAGDPMIADYLLHSGERNHNMDVLARTHLNHQVIPITELIGKGKKQLRMDEVATRRVADYSGEDADVAWRLGGILEKQLARDGLKELYDELEIPLIEVLAELEYTGIRLDVPLLRRLGESMVAQLRDVEEDIYRQAGREFNIASLKQLRQVLFDELQLPVKRRTGISGDASTDQATLEWLAEQGHELPKKLCEHRQIAKLKSTYVDALPALVNEKTGRLHTSFNQTVAATGRLSSSDPNLQNIPIRSEFGGQIRQAFLPEKDWQLLTADYSQVELRLLAHFSEDERLRQTFAEGRDIHAAVAAEIFAVPEAEATRDMRRVAKTVNFGILYGMSAVGLAARLGMPRDEAGRFIDSYFQRYPRVLEFQSRLLETCRKRGYVSTILGRRRAISGIRPRSTYQQRNQPEREAINMEIQGSAADLIKTAMLHLHRRLKRGGFRTRMLLQIHDELVFEVPPDEVTKAAKAVHEEMTGALASRLQVPLEVDLAVGPNWLEVKPLETP
jgi:DNA polymerase-1